jgi:hypothetical protein
VCVTLLFVKKELFVEKLSTKKVDTAKASSICALAQKPMGFWILVAGLLFCCLLFIVSTSFIVFTTFNFYPHKRVRLFRMQR